VTKTVNASWDQDSFAWYADTGGEGTGQIGSTNANPTTLYTDAQHRLRYLIQETAGATTGDTPIFRLEYRVDPAGGTNFGAWTPADSDDTYFTAVTSANVTDGAGTSQQIGGGTFRDGDFVYVDGGGSDTGAMAATQGNDEYECEWVIAWNDASARDATFEFQVTIQGSALDTYTNTTRVTPVRLPQTITSSGSPSVTLPAVTADGSGGIKWLGESTLLLPGITASGSGSTHAYMYLRPDGVITLGSWTDNADGTTNIYQAIDEATPSDADYVKSETEPSSSTFEVSLSNPTETVDDTKDHVVSYRYAKNDTSSTINLVVSLRLGTGTEIASWTHNNIGTTVTQADQTLTGPQVTAITGYTDLRLRFVATEV